VAASLASLNDALIASADPASRFNLPVVDDLTVCFTDKFDAYRLGLPMLIDWACQ
jgi:hypothetical protein